ncbi:MAG TPA: BamA/TamA family outer membrane protein [Flavobacteriales bacterium]|nr:BamA/TamA family outer membrane protein [Flavobacteriales bacterium]
MTDLYRWPALGVLLALLLATAGEAIAQEKRAYKGPFVVSGIVYEGNKVTKEVVMVRELTFQEGDTLTSEQLYTRIERSKQNLYNLSLFNLVIITPTYLGEHEVFITVTVNERWYWWPEPIFKIADPNFNTWWLTRDFRRVNWGTYLTRRNFRGLDQTLYIKFQLGYTREFGLRYRIPFVDQRQRWGVSLGGGYAEQNETTVGTVDNKRVFIRDDLSVVRSEWRVQGQATLRPAFDIRHHFRLGYVNAVARDTLLNSTSDYFHASASRTSYVTAGYTMMLDLRDSRAFSTDGWMVQGSIDRLGLGVLGHNEPAVTLLDGTYQHQWRTSRRWSFGGQVRGRVTLGGDIPYYNQQGLGYDDYVRGYEYYVIDGQHYGLFRGNALFAIIVPRDYYVHPIPLESFRTVHVAVYVNAFVDAGYVWDRYYAEQNFLDNTPMSGGGLGLDLVSSYDQVARFEYSINALGETGFYLHFMQPF